MDTLDNLLNQYDRGTLSRRQLVQGLLMLAVPALAGAQQMNDPVRARTINHVHIVVNDLEQSKTFYGKLLGANFSHAFSKDIHSMVLPGEAGWLSLDGGTSQSDPEKKNRLGHFAIGIDRFNAGETTAAIKKVLPDLKVQGAPDARSVFIFDPNGIRVQLMSKEDKGAA